MQYIEPLCSLSEIDVLDEVSYKFNNKYYAAEATLRACQYADAPPVNSSEALKYAKGFIFVCSAKEVIA